MWNSDTISGLLILGISVIAWEQSRAFSYYGGVFVSWTLLILFGLGATLFIKGLVQGEKIRFWSEDAQKIQVAVMALGLALYLIAVFYLGFLIASILSYTGFSVMLTPKETRRSSLVWLRALGVGATVTLLFYGVFKLALLVPLPVGVLFGGS